MHEKLGLRPATRLRILVHPSNSSPTITRRYDCIEEVEQLLVSIALTQMAGANLSPLC